MRRTTLLSGRVVRWHVVGKRWLHNFPRAASDTQTDAEFQVGKDIVSRNDDSNYTKEAISITKLGAAVNVVLSVAKVATGVAISSTALVADGVHSFSDLVSDALTGFVVLKSRQPPDEDHPYGHGKVRGPACCSGIRCEQRFALHRLRHWERWAYQVYWSWLPVVLRTKAMATS